MFHYDCQRLQLFSLFCHSSDRGEWQPEMSLHCQTICSLQESCGPQSVTVEHLYWPSFYLPFPIRSLRQHWISRWVHPTAQDDLKMTWRDAAADNLHASSRVSSVCKPSTVTFFTRTGDEPYKMNKNRTSVELALFFEKMTDKLGHFVVFTRLCSLANFIFYKMPKCRDVLATPW